MATDLGKVGMVDKGNYNSGSTYEAMDVVTYNSATYIAIQDVPVNTAPTNTSYWREAFSNALIGNSDISNVAASITAAIGNIANPNNYSLSHAVAKFRYGFVTSDATISNIPDGTYLLIIAKTQYTQSSISIIDYNGVQILGGNTNEVITRTVNPDTSINISWQLGTFSNYCLILLN